MDHQLNQTARRMFLALAAIVGCLAVVGLGVILLAWPFAKPLPYLLGLLAGGGLSAAKLFLLKRNLGKTIDLESEQAQNLTRLHFVLRHLLTAAVLACVVLLRTYFVLIGTLLGILSLQLAAYVEGWIERREEKKRFALHGVPSALPPETEED